MWHNQYNGILQPKKRNEILIYVILMNLSNFTLDEKSDTKDYMFYDSTYLYEMSRKGNVYREKAEVLEVEIDCGRAEGISFLFSYFFLFLSDGSIF